jgi:hypothetical protein
MADRESLCDQFSCFGKSIGCVVVELFRIENCMLLLIQKIIGKSYSDPCAQQEPLQDWAGIGLSRRILLMYQEAQVLSRCCLS